MNVVRRVGTTIGAVLMSVVLSACAAEVTRHGHLFTSADLQQVQPGMSKEQVKLALGTPNTTSAVGGGGAFYYMSTTTETRSFFKPTVKDRRVAAIYFNEFGSVEKVANFGLKDGKVFDFIARETSSHASNDSIIRSLFRNLGNRRGVAKSDSPI